MNFFRIFGANLRLRKIFEIFDRVSRSLERHRRSPRHPIGTLAQKILKLVETSSEPVFGFILSWHKGVLPISTLFQLAVFVNFFNGPVSKYRVQLIHYLNVQSKFFYSNIIIINFEMLASYVNLNIIQVNGQMAFEARIIQK